MRKKKYYAYFIPRNKHLGIKESWGECEKIVSGESGAKFKGFVNRSDAEDWLKAGANYNRKRIFRPGIYFDSGTGRGMGVEISVTDENGHNLLSKVLPRKRLNSFGKFITLDNATNNYGELLACYYALKIALKEKKKIIFGDSKLIINYWSKGFISDVIDAGTIALAKSVAQLRKEFEAKGGKFEYVSGDLNSADLGFHK